jgi:hypothetical protein
MRHRMSTAVDFSQHRKWLVDEAFPDATVVRVVLDYLKVHVKALLYVAFAPAEARRIARQLEFHFTPKHGSRVGVRPRGARQPVLGTPAR